MILISHWDLDGVFCLYLFYKKFGDIFKVYFSGPRIINKTLAKLIYEEKNNEEIYIVDISPNQEAIYLSSCFKEAYWIDHHVINDFEETSRVHLIIEKEKSAARVLLKYFNISDPLIDLVDDIDSNNIKDDLERDLRDLITAIRFYNPKTYSIHFTTIAKEILIKGNIKDIVEKRREIINKYRRYLKEKEDKIILSTKILKFKDNNVFIVDCEDNIPSFFIMDVLKNKIAEKIDYLIILYKNRGEIRTLTYKNVINLAKFLGGGGHFFAAGFQFDRKERIIEKIKEYFEKNILNEEKPIV